MGLWARITGVDKESIKASAVAAAKATAQPRSSLGTFSSPAKEAAVPAQTAAIVMKNNAETVTSANEAFKGVLDMVKTFNTAVSEEAAARYGPTQEDMLEADIEAVDDGTDWLAVANQVIPQVMPTIEKLAVAIAQRGVQANNAPGAAWTGFPVANSTQNAMPQVAPTSPSSEPSPPSNAPPITPEMLIQLAKANRAELAGIKTLAGKRIGQGLAQNGLSVDVLKKAIANLEKIVPHEAVQAEDDEQTTLEAIA